MEVSYVMPTTPQTKLFLKNGLTNKKAVKTNIGSGTSPPLTVEDWGIECVSITDNAAPQMNVVVVNERSNFWNSSILKDDTIPTTIDRYIPMFNLW